MKQYRLLKDLPGIKAGAVFNLFDDEDSLIVRYYSDGITIEERLVINNHDWFEEIQKKEYTEKDMIEFAEFCHETLNKTEHSYGFLLTEWL